MKKVMLNSILLILTALVLGGCYTQVLTRPSEEGTAERWEEEHYYRSVYRDPCRWCSPWHYYYRFPWWLDQYYWWDHYDPEPVTPERRERFDRRRGLNESLESIIDRISPPESAPETRPAPAPQGEQEEEQDEDNNDRAPRRRGL